MQCPCKLYPNCQSIICYAKKLMYSSIEKCLIATKNPNTGFPKSRVSKKSMGL